MIGFEERYRYLVAYGLLIDAIQSRGVSAALTNIWQIALCMLGLLFLLRWLVFEKL